MPPPCLTWTKLLALRGRYARLPVSYDRLEQSKTPTPSRIHSMLPAVLPVSALLSKSAIRAPTAHWNVPIAELGCAKGFTHKASLCGEPVRSPALAVPSPLSDSHCQKALRLIASPWHGHNRVRRIYGCVPAAPFPGCPAR